MKLILVDDDSHVLETWEDIEEWGLDKVASRSMLGQEIQNEIDKALKSKR